MQYSREYSGAHDTHLSKVRYRPIEAAIRWSALTPHEELILEVLQDRRIPEPGDFPEWPELQLNTERIYDAIVNGELPYGIDGVTVRDGSRMDHPNLTIRHVDLKSWMSRYYPEHRPEFLFGWLDGIGPPTISIEAIHALVLERDALRSLIEPRDQHIRVRRKQDRRTEVPIQSDAHGTALSARAETTYLHVIGGLLTLMLGRAASERHRPAFRTQESIISALIEQHGERLGITQRTLEAKFAAAKRKLSMD